VTVPPFFVAAAGVAVPVAVLSFSELLEPHAATTIAIAATTGNASLLTTRLLRLRY
jgi:hypothetical protein